MQLNVVRTTLVVGKDHKHPQAIPRLVTRRWPGEATADIDCGDADAESFYKLNCTIFACPILVLRRNKEHTQNLIFPPANRGADHLLSRADCIVNLVTAG
jgi:hypothetical protein